MLEIFFKIIPIAKLYRPLLRISKLGLDEKKKKDATTFLKKHQNFG